jgi:hypothetical protein
MSGIICSVEIILKNPDALFGSAPTAGQPPPFATTTD